MAKRHQSKTTAPELKSVRLAFRAYRRESRGQSGYPPRLRQLVAAAVAGGQSNCDVGKAAGITERSVRNWLNEISSPQELTVVADPGREAHSSPGEEAIARIHLCSGVTIDLPLCKLTAPMIGMLNQVEGPGPKGLR